MARIPNAIAVADLGSSESWKRRTLEMMTLGMATRYRIYNRQ